MEAHIYMEAEGYMVFETMQNFVKFLVPKQLTDIYGIKNYDNGYLAVDTNYGEEYVDISAIAASIGSTFAFISGLTLICIPLVRAFDII